MGFVAEIPFIGGFFQSGAGLDGEFCAIEAERTFILCEVEAEVLFEDACESAGAEVA